MSNRLCPALVLPLLTLFLAGPARAATHVVQPDGAGDFPTIQAALDAALNGDVVELTDGTFRGEGNFNLTLPGAQITLRSRSGNPELCVIDVQGTAESPRRGITINQGEGEGTVLEGFTITGAHVVGGNCGSALQIVGDSNPTVRNCRFVGNQSACGGGVWAQGGAPRFTDCVFLDNATAGDGGAFMITNSSPVLTRCRFLDNTATQAGGALSGNFESAPVIDLCTFSGNEAGAGGAVWARQAASFVFLRCTFSGNRAGEDQGILGTRDSASLGLSTCLIVNSPAGAAFSCLGTPDITLACSNVFGNAGGDWTGCVDGQLGVNGNISVDPQFCSADPDAARYWWLQSDSPCAVGNHPNSALCGDMGAWGVGCDTTPVQRTTWGALKGSRP